jgi:ABC-2 type transport system permease protein
MVINDFIFLFVFVIFLSYFTWTGFTFGNFLLIHSIIAFQYAIVNGLFSNIWDLPNIVEQGKLDYYLSFPINTLGFLVHTKINVHSLWDILFALISMVIYSVFFNSGSSIIFISKRFLILSFALVFAVGFFVMIGSISFRLQRWSKVRDLFESFFLVFGSYPPTIFQHNKILFVLVAMIGLYPGVFLPYQMLISDTHLQDRVILVLASIAMFIVWIWIFYRWLRRYSSGNLVVQM